MSFIVPPIFTAEYCTHKAVAVCRRHPVLLSLELAMVLMLWAHLIITCAVVPAIKNRIKKWERPVARFHLGPMKAGRTAETTRPARGYPFVQRVCYVSSLAKYPSRKLPHPAVELDADSAMCSVCFDDFEEPGSIITRRLFKKQGTISAPTLWKTTCGHIFHEACLLEWFRSSGGSICPYCNQDAATVTASFATPLCR